MPTIRINGREVEISVPIPLEYILKGGRARDSKEIRIKQLVKWYDMAERSLIDEARKLEVPNGIEKEAWEELRYGAGKFIFEMSPLLASLAILVRTCRQMGYNLTVEEISKKTGLISSEILERQIRTVEKLRLELNEQHLKKSYSNFINCCKYHTSKDNDAQRVIPLLHEDLPTVLNAGKETKFNWSDTLEHLQSIVLYGEDKLGHPMSNEDLFKFYVEMRKTLFGKKTPKLPTVEDGKKIMAEERRDIIGYDEMPSEISKRIDEEETKRVMGFARYKFIPPYISKAFGEFLGVSPEEFVRQYDVKLREMSELPHMKAGKFKPHLFYEMLRLFSKNEGPIAKEELPKSITTTGGNFYKPEEVESAATFLVNVRMILTEGNSYRRNPDFVNKQ